MSQIKNRINVIEYSSEYYEKWQNFIEKSNNSTVFHDLRFFDYHPNDRFENHHLIFLKNDKIRAVITGTKREDEQSRKVYVSHSGASYGGFAFPIDNGVKETHDILEAFFDWLRQNNYNAVRITPPPLYYSHFPNNHVEFTFMKNGFSIVKSELTSIVHLQDSIEENFSVFKPTARTATRKAMKEGLEVKFVEDYTEFYKILENNLAMRHNVKPTHTLNELERLNKLLPGKILQIGTFTEGKMIAGVTLFTANPRALLAFYISHDNTYQEKRPLNILFYEIMKWGISNHYKILDFGTYTLNMEPNFGLARFKEGFGARGLNRTTWFCEL